MPFDMQAYLKELTTTAAVSDDDRKVFEKYLTTPAAVKFVEEHQLRQSDYDKNYSKLKEEKTALETEKQTVAALQQQLAGKEPGWTKEKQRLADELVAARG